MHWKTTDYAGWGRTLTASGQIARPERLSDLAVLAADEPAPAIGNRRSYGDACLNDGGKTIDMTRLDRLVDFDSATGKLTAEAGIRIGEIVNVFAPRGWLPMVLPGTGFATVGGAIGHDVHGKNHHNAGSFGQHVLGFSLINAKGQQDVTPESNPELFKATMGGIGQTGVITRATMQLGRCKGDAVRLTERRVVDLDEFIELLDRSEATYAVGWIDATAHGSQLGRGILEEAETEAGPAPAPKQPKTIPFNAPPFTLASPVVRIFNSAYYRRVPENGRSVVKPISEFFFPLDRINNWNRLYGKKGFHQFQCVVPVAETEALREMLKQIAKARLASPLAVLKRMGSGCAGYMSFPMDGYTLAIDFRNQSGASSLIGTLEEITAHAGGRVYLAKDALASAERLRTMYPDFDRWSAIVNEYDPKGVYVTDIVAPTRTAECAMNNTWIIPWRHLNHGASHGA